MRQKIKQMNSLETVDGSGGGVPHGVTVVKKTERTKRDIPKSRIL